MTALGDTVRLAAEIRDQNGNVINAPGQVQWASGDPAVAVVDGGTVRATGNGETSITASIGAIRGGAAVTVAQQASTIDVSPDQSGLAPGDTVRLNADVRDANGHVVEDAAVSWTSSDLSVARVDSVGVVTALATGEAVIEGRAGPVRDTANILVYGRDRTALTALYTAADGPNWTNSDGWLSEAPLGEWYGVETDAEGRVVSLDLNGNQLRGTIAEQLAGLDGLKHLDLAINQLAGVIPAELASLAGLTGLYLNDNELSGPISGELGNLSNLAYLDLSYNQLTGPIPEEIASLKDLEILSLNDNELTGSIPEGLGGLDQLRLLFLDGNELTGSIPGALGNLASLELLDLGFNDLAGSVPAQLGSLASLSQIYLDDNDLSGMIPPEIGGLTLLQVLVLDNNELLEGPLPLQLTSLTELDVLTAEGTDLCAPSDPAFVGWMETIGWVRVVACGS